MTSVVACTSRFLVAFWKSVTAGGPEVFWKIAKLKISELS